MDRYVVYQFLNPLGRKRLGFTQLQTSDPVVAHGLVEEQHQSSVTGLWLLPAWLSPLGVLFRWLIWPPIPKPELAEFLRSLGVMLRAGLAIDVALGDLDRQAKNRSLRHLTSGLLRGVQAGRPLSASMAHYKDQVPNAIRHLVNIGETSGNLDQVLLDAAAHLARTLTLKQDMLRALIYPFFVVVSIIAAALFWLLYVLPDLADMFRQMGAGLPPMTQWMLDTSNDLSRLNQLVSPVWVLAVALLVVVLGAQDSVRRIIAAVMIRMPIFGRLIRTGNEAFIAEYLALLFRSGIQLVDCLRIIESACPNHLYRAAMRETRLGIERGHTLADELAQRQLFPQLLIRLVNLGEQSGSLDVQLETLAAEQQRKLTHLISTLSEVVKPTILLLAGGMFIFVIVAFLLPVYDLIAQSSQV